MSEFIKTEAQKKAISLLSGNARHICLFGGSRAGKSLILMYALIIRACRVKSRHCVFRLNFNHIKRSLVMETLPKVMSLCFPDLKYDLNKTDYYITLPNGSQIFFAGLDTGERIEKVLGQEHSTLWFNEVSQIPYSSVQLALSRLAEKNSLKKKVYYDMNPNTKASWPYYLFINKLDPIDETPLADPDDYVSLKMNPSENLLNIDSEYLKVLEAMPEKERNRFLHGEFNDETEGQVYYSFRIDEHVKETTRINGTLFSAHDFNVNPLTAIVAQFYDNKFYIHDEIWLENSDTYKLCDEMKRRGYSGTTAIPDSTSRNRKTSGQSDFDIMKASGMNVLSTHNPFVKDRCNNVNRLFQENRIIINPKCRKLINDLSKVSWKDNKIDAGPEKKLGHITDCLGYLLWKLEPFKKETAKIFSSER